MTTTFTLRRATASDASAIRALIYRVGNNPISLDWRRFWLAVDAHDRLLACGQVKPHGDGSRELASLAVQPAWRGQGLARAVVEQLLAENPPPLYLTCRASLGDFYRRFGFELARPPDLPPYFRRIAALAGWFHRLFPRREALLVMVNR